MSGQLKPATRSQQIYLPGGFGPVGIGTGVGPASAGWIKLAFTKINATSTIRIIFFRILFSSRVGSRLSAPRPRIFLSGAPHANSFVNLLLAAGRGAGRVLALTCIALPVTDKTIASDVRTKLSQTSLQINSSSTTSFFGPM